MTQFAIFAVMTGLAVLIALAPLSRSRAPRPTGAEASDHALYRDQFEAIGREEAAGFVSAEEAESARGEIARRILAARQVRADAAGGGGAARWTGLALVLAIPAIALPLYLAWGQPGMPGHSAAEQRARQAAAETDVAQLVARVEDHLAEDPQDAQGWRVLAPVYLRMGRYDAAVDAYRNALRLSDGDDAALLADLGEAIAAAASGVVTEEAREVLQRAAGSDPSAVKPRFLLAVAAEQDGDWRAASDGWRALLADAPADAPWRSEIEARLAAAQASLEGGPSEEDVAAARDMSPEQRSAMIEGMVTRLAERLASDGADLDGWLQLARAYVVLGRTEEARAALASAQENFPEEAGRIEDASRRLGIGS
ncbi:c-type cytochrome biogenesis protein CcmI [Lutibaculum baratangense]|uniref:Cytochrome c heme lyase subunit CcmH n=1 Tax=Lutibaculum baratangense AMV1 TaxID=631454 RepID=V4T8A3_9HYPH|nr:c-type cytochrome biogenesis protein CcmI [Lutibaculum baratangense]ESR22813.1 Cytochrome c heme lyase subunit CcmH [Lutibaculum baratangense AMV1]